MVLEKYHLPTCGLAGSFARSIGERVLCFALWHVESCEEKTTSEW